MIWQFFYDYYTMMLESSWFLQHIQFFHPTVLNDFPVNLFYLGHSCGKVDERRGTGHPCPSKNVRA